MTRGVRGRGAERQVILMDMAMPGLDGLQPEAGARGYLLKEALDVDLAATIKALAAGKQIIGPGVMPASRADPQYDRLTPRDKTDPGISRARNRANLMAELGIHRTTDLILWAVKKGLVHLS
ncbi:MAG: hypothetical protein ACLP59_32770 [Bryobacteraceae bacterium]